jgi:hypothetical protein
LQGRLSEEDNSFGIYPEDVIKKIDEFIEKSIIFAHKEQKKSIAAN